MMLDAFHRKHDYLRISLTDNCNLRCFYCMPQEDLELTPASKLMQAHEIEALARIFVELGVNKIRLTGGEPLVRKDAADIIRRLSALPVKLTMTTNGIRLEDFRSTLRDAGIRSINISIDTLQPERFLQLTRRDLLPVVRKNIALMLEDQMTVKLNMVVMKGLNDDEIHDFVGLTKDQPLHVRFIEFMPFSGNQWHQERVFTWQEILARIADKYDIEPLERVPHDTAKKYRIPGYAGTFAVISTMSAPFCGDCNRLRLTADGKMKNCLFSSSETDLLTPFRSGEEVVPLILQSVKDKKAVLGGQFEADLEKVDAAKIQNRSMITIGG